MKASEHERSAGGELPQGPTRGDTRLVQRDMTSDPTWLILPQVTSGNVWRPFCGHRCGRELLAASGQDQRWLSMSYLE